MWCTCSQRARSLCLSVYRSDDQPPEGNNWKTVNLRPFAIIAIATTLLPKVKSKFRPFYIRSRLITYAWSLAVDQHVVRGLRSLILPHIELLYTYWCRVSFCIGGCCGPQTAEGGEAGFERDTILPKIRHDFHNLIFGKLSTHMPLLVMKLHNSAVVGLSGPARVNINLKPLGGFRNDEITGKSISIGNNDRDRALWEANSYRRQ